MVANELSTNYSSLYITSEATNGKCRKCAEDTHASSLGSSIKIPKTDGTIVIVAIKRKPIHQTAAVFV